MNKTYNTILLMFTALCTVITVNAQVTFSNMGSSLGSVSGQTFEDCAVDMNGDFLDDIVRVTSSKIYIDYQQEDGSFMQVEYDLNTQAPPSWSLAAADIDGNGFTDLLFGGGSAVSFIYANDDGSGFTEDYKSEYIFAQRTTFADIDNDGNLDAFVCHDVDQSHPYRNDGSGNLTLDQTLIVTEDRPGNYAAIWVDYDNDWDTDLYITKCKQGSAPGDIDRTNLMYRNNGDGTYTEVGEEINMDDNAQSWATVFEDFDNDGDFDAFIVNHDEENRFMINDGLGNFTESITTTNISSTDLGAWENASGDFNNDGFVDIFSELNNALYINNGDMTFTGQTLPFDDGGIGDMNNDGFLDVIKGNSLWLNDGNDNNWVKINTLGIISNKNGIGARVEIYGEWGVQIREVRSGQSFSPMSSLTIHFGLGTATAIDQLVIKWPSGMETILENVEINTTHNIPEADCLLAESNLNVMGSTALCAGESVQISAPDGFTTYDWSNGETTQTITVTTPGAYSAILINADECFSLTNQVVVTQIIDEAPTIALEGENIFCEGESVVLSTSSTQNPVWSNQVAGQTIEVSESGVYTVSVDGVCATDPIVSEAVEITVLETTNPIADDVTISAPGTATLMATGDNLEWYNQPTGGSPIGTGPTYETPVLTQDTIFYVESHTISGGALQDGGKLDNSGNGGLPSTGAHSIFDAYEPFTILSVTVYLPENAPSGIRFIQLVDENGGVLETTAVDINQPVQVVELNFDVPVGTGLSLRCPQNNLFRNSSGVNYPYPIGDVGEITGSLFGPGWYYYFYDWKIQKDKTECISERIPVNVSLLTATEDLDQTIAALNIFPNPTDGKAFIQFEAIDNTPMEIAIFNSIGQKVMEEALQTRIGNNVSELDLSTLPKGMYSVQLTANGQKGSWKIAVQ